MPGIFVSILIFAFPCAIIQNSFFQRALEGHCPEAAYSLGWMYATGCGVSQSDECALKFFVQAAAYGYSEAQLLLARVYDMGSIVTRDESRALSLYRKAAIPHDEDAMAIVFRGEVPEQAQERADAWIAVHDECPLVYAGERENIYAQRRAAELLLAAGSDQKDAGLAWLKKAAQNGESGAQVLLGDMFLKGNIVWQSDDEALKWFCKAAAMNDHDAQMKLADMHESGRAGDCDQSKNWRELAAFAKKDEKKE